MASLDAQMSKCELRAHIIVGTGSGREGKNFWNVIEVISNRNAANTRSETESTA